MKIAIPTKDNFVDNHFGHCDTYTIITTDDNNNILKKEFLPSPQGCGCKSNIAETFQQIGVEVMLAGGIGEGAINILSRHGINVVRGCSGDVDILAKKYTGGELVDSGVSCEQHEHHNEKGHTCNH